MLLGSVAVWYKLVCSINDRVSVYASGIGPRIRGFDQ
jgi:hypothetical protein